MNNTQWWLSQRETKHLYINLRSWESTLRICLLTCCQQNHFAHRKLQIIPWSARSVWYHDFGLNIQRMASTKIKLLSEARATHITHANSRRCWQIVPHPVGVFCSLLLPPKCHVMQKTWTCSKCSIFCDFPYVFLSTPDQPINTLHCRRI